MMNGIKMENFNFSREEMLDHLPRGKCAEIGVARGEYSREIIRRNPEMLYLIDAYANFELGNDRKDSNMVEDDHHQLRYENVYREYFNYKNVKIVRSKSIYASRIFPFEYFDWIYIDADHSYKGCYNDLVAYDKVVKSNGIICGHDFHPKYRRKAGFEVNEAVEDFVKERNYILLGSTNEDKWKSFIIVKNDKTKEDFLNSIYHNQKLTPGVIKTENGLLKMN